MNTKELIETKQEELKNLKTKYQQEKEKEILDKKSDEYFCKHFKMDMSHNMNPIEEYWGQYQRRFRNSFNLNDNSFNESILMELREEYVKDVKEEVDELVKQFDLLFKELKEAKEKENDKNRN